MASALRLTFVGAAGVGVLALVGAVLAPPLVVSQVSVTGTDSATRAEAETLTRQFLAAHATLMGQPRLFLVQPRSLATEMTAHLPRVATAVVLRQVPGTLAVHLREKVPVAYLGVNGRLLALDGDGRAIADVSADDAQRSPLPFIRDLHTSTPIRPGDPVLSPAVVALLHDVVVRLPERFSVSVGELTIPSIGTEEVDVTTSGGWRLLFDSTRPLDEQLGALEKVVTEDLGPADLARLDYVDLRIPGKVYYRVGRAPAGARPTPRSP